MSYNPVFLSFNSKQLRGKKIHMAEEESKKVEVAEVSAEPAPAAEVPKDVAKEKEVDKSPPLTEEKPDESKALVAVEKVADPTPAEKSSGGSADRDVVLARVETEKRMSLIKAWEESEKSQAENKAVKKMSAITAWENSKKAAVEAELKKIEISTIFNAFIHKGYMMIRSNRHEDLKVTIDRKPEDLEKKKAEYAEKMKNKIAILHKEAEERRAMVEARRGEELLKAEEMAAKYRATGLAPKKLFGCFGP